MPQNPAAGLVSCDSNSLLSIVVPVYNEEEVVEASYQRTGVVLDSLDMQAELLFVNDGSSDKTVSILEQLCTADPRVGLVNLSRNFGKEIAMTAGLDYARGDAVVIIDADLQDPPELIPELVQYWKRGYRCGVCPPYRSGGRVVVQENNGARILSYYETRQPRHHPGGYWRFSFIEPPRSRCTQPAA
jgi:glycosyltransferase involved in cell wall biosynthesis